MSDKVNYSYPEVGSIAQAIKQQIRTGSFWNEMSPASKESLDQMATAMARMVSGDGPYWDAIIGFAKACTATTPETALKPPSTQAQRIGLEAIERAVREIPLRNDAT